jgi:uncharacterized phage protein gp47/JayE
MPHRNGAASIYGVLMPYTRPTLTQLRDQAMQDISAAPIGVDGFLRFAVVRVLAWVQAGFAYLHYGYIDWISLMSVPWTAAFEFLTGWAALIGVFQKDATPAAGPVNFTGTSGVPILIGTAIVRSDGASFTATAAATWLGGTATIPVIANIVGSAGNSDAGTVMRLSSPIAGVVSAGVVAAPGLLGGADQEAPGAFKNRMMAEFANAPQGGDRYDYLEWADAVPGVTRAWVAPNGAGAGTVVVYTMFDLTEAEFGGFPQGVNGVATNEKRDTPAIGDQLAVANAIFSPQPVCALVYSCAPIATPVAFTVANLGVNNTDAMQASIKTALTAMLLENGNVGGTVNPDGGGTWPPIDPDIWYAALNAIPGLSAFTVSTPSAPIMPVAGQLFTLGTCTFSA